MDSLSQSRTVLMRAMVIGVHAPDERYQSDPVCIEKADADPDSEPLSSSVHTQTHKQHRHNYLP